MHKVDIFTSALNNITHIKGLSMGKLTGLALLVLTMPSVVTALDNAPADGTTWQVDKPYAHAVMLHDAEADTWARALLLRDKVTAFELLRAALYLYDIHYPGTVAKAIAKTK